jgi:hypothetical protein
MTVREGPRSTAVRPEAISGDLETASKWQWVQRHWEAFLPTVTAYWHRLPEEAVQHLSGDRPSLVQLVKRHYAPQESGAEAQVNAWLAGLSTDSAPSLPATEKGRGGSDTTGRQGTFEGVTAAEGSPFTGW